MEWRGVLDQTASCPVSHAIQSLIRSVRLGSGTSDENDVELSRIRESECPSTRHDQKLLGEMEKSGGGHTLHTTVQMKEQQQCRLLLAEDGGWGGKIHQA